MHKKNNIHIIKKDFEQCRTILNAIGDENRQNIIIALLGTIATAGLRVGEITKLSHLSRPAVSHHLQILKRENIISMRSIGTMNFYYMNASSSVMKLKKLIDDIEMCIK